MSNNMQSYYCSHYSATHTRSTPAGPGPRKSSQSDVQGDSSRRDHERAVNYKQQQYNYFQPTALSTQGALSLLLPSLYQKSQVSNNTARSSSTYTCTSNTTTLQSSHTTKELVDIKIESNKDLNVEKVNEELKTNNIECEDLIKFDDELPCQQEVQKPNVSQQINDSQTVDNLLIQHKENENNNKSKINSDKVDNKFLNSNFLCLEEITKDTGYEVSHDEMRAEYYRAVETLLLNVKKLSDKVIKFQGSTEDEQKLQKEVQDMKINLKKFNDGGYRRTKEKFVNAIELMRRCSQHLKKQQSIKKVR